MSPLLPVRAGEISGPLLGCAVGALRDDGSPCDLGESGELVVSAPMPSMPVGLWGDDSGDRLASTYFERFPGHWHHGDWITLLDDVGACTITGRSDATMNRGGIRMGTAEFYAVLDTDPQVADSLIVHVTRRDGHPVDELVLLVAADVADDAIDALVRSVRADVRERLSPRHVPDRVLVVPAIPRTRSGKRIELPVKRILEGADPAVVLEASSLDRPDLIGPLVERLLAD